jgi:hypothetical protein
MMASFDLQMLVPVLTTSATQISVATLRSSFMKRRIGLISTSKRRKRSKRRKTRKKKELHGMFHWEYCILNISALSTPDSD